VADGDVGTKVQGLYGTITIHADGSYTYELDNSKRAVQALNDGDKLVDTFSYTLTDADGDKSTTTVKISIHGKTDAPLVLAGVEDGGPINGKFSYTGLDALTPYLVSQQPSHGAITVDANGNWVYTPHADYNGQDSFVVAIKDEFGKTTTEVITINLAPEQDAFDDNASASETTPLVIDVLANDGFEGSGTKVTHINGAAISAGGAAVAVDHGKVTLGTDGKLTFVADAGYEGKTSFSYTANSAQGTPETATVNVTVTSPLKTEADTIEIFESGGTGGKVDVLLTIDLSGSMLESVRWNPVTEVWETRLDLVKQAIANLFASGSVNSVRLYSFETDSQEKFYDSGVNGGWFTNLDDALAVVNGLFTAGGNTSYTSAITNILNTYEAPPHGNSNLVSIFMSDGAPNSWETFTPELESAWIQFLESNGFGASYALGVGEGITNVNVGALEEIAWSPGETAGAIPSGQMDPNAMVVEDDLGQLTETLKNLVRQGHTTVGNATSNDLGGTVGWDASGWRIASIDYVDANGVTKTYVFTEAQSSTTINAYTSTGLLIGKFTISGNGSYSFTGLDNFDTTQDVSSVMHYTARDAAGSLSSTTLTLTVKDHGSSGAKAAVMLGDMDDASVEHKEAVEPASIGHEVRGTPGDDLLIGTHEDDLFIWNQGDQGTEAAPAKDVVQDFGMGIDEHAGRDKLVLNDLLQGEELVTDLSAYLHLEKSREGQDTLIKVSSDGKLNADGSNFNQTITVKGVDLVGDPHTGTATDQNALIKQLISQGKLSVDGQH
jgi:VCBS repeat-containing protein